MSDAALQNSSIAVARGQVLDRLRLRDSAFHFSTSVAALIVLAILAGVIVALFIGAMPALRNFGAGFLVTQRWNPVTGYGALAPIYGTP